MLATSLMSSTCASPEKPNPFYQPAASAFMRREFLGLMSATIGWTFLPCAAAQDASGKGGKNAKNGKGDDKSKARGPVFQGEYVLPASLAEFSKLSVVLGRV
ncbi:MAG: hypothetical protein WCP35_14220, partial [Verrucomicrobiota bacterium]